jgi:hypothetical protein
LLSEAGAADERRIRRLEKDLEVRLEDEGAGRAAGAGQGVEKEEDEARDAVVVAELRRGALPVIRLCNERGILETKTVSFVALLSLLDRSCTLDALDDEAERRTALPPLPPRALLVDAVERPRASSIVLTGYLEPASRPIVLRRSGPAASTAVSAVVPLPALVYRAEWYRRDRTLRALSIAVCSPDLSGPPGPDAPLFRFPLSNVYGYHSSSTAAWGNRPGAVCWPSMGSIGPLELDEIPERALIRGFLSVPNNADLFGRGVSHNGPHTDYAAFLEDLDGRKTFPRDWLIPAELTVRNFHDAPAGTSY